MQPVHDNVSSKLPYVLIPLAFVIVVVMGVWFVVKGVEMARGASSSGDQTVSAREPATSKKGYASAAVSTRAVPTPPSTPSPPPAEPAPPTTLAPPSFPSIKLQALFYKSRNSAVVINGQILEVGQQVDDVKVVSISRQIVVVEWQGETKELVLP